MDRFSDANLREDAAAAVAFESGLADYVALTADEAADREPAPWSAPWLERHRAAMREADEIDSLKARLGETVCISGYNAVLNAPTLRAAAVAMRAHYVSCAICGSDEHVVVSDRVQLGKTNAACCEGKAA